MERFLWALTLCGIAANQWGHHEMAKVFIIMATALALLWALDALAYWIANVR